MRLILEMKKVKRTGFFPAFIIGGLLAAAVPILDMAVRSDVYINAPGSPVSILLNADWQMMAMLNILLLVIGSCIMYHSEFNDNAMQKMNTLPVKESSLFFSKTIVIFIMSLFVLLLEAAGLAFAAFYWFDMPKEDLIDLIQNFGFIFLLTIPCVLISLIIASVCKNMWVSLGICVVCVFTATILPMHNFVLSLFPHALPFQIFEGMADSMVVKYIVAAVAEFFILFITEFVIIRVRRSFE